MKFLAGTAALLVGVSAIALSGRAADDLPQVDTALVVSVDVSNSVDDARYKLQMEGIAEALEDPGVLQAITGGPSGGILFSMVTWADRPTMNIPWTRIATKEDAAAVAKRIRKLPQQGGEFTCMTRMLRSANDKIVPQIPAKTMRVVIDVSGDGPENCNPDEPIEKVRDELVAGGVTINGLPILETDDEKAAAAPSAGAQAAPAPSLEAWYKDHVQGGNGSFTLPAHGYSDFGRAIRQKFVIEISGTEPPKRAASVDDRLVDVDRAIQSARARLALEVDQPR